MDAKSYNIRVPKRWARLTLIVGVTALIVAPLTAVAMHTFNDVPDTHTFHADIEWLEASGVTKGCNPPANTLFCPDDDVTRGQMAAFMNRFAGYLGAEDGTPAQADNADTVDGKHASDFVEEGEANSVSAGMTTNEAGIATAASSGTTVLTGGVQEILSVTIDAPTSGFVVVTATGEAIISHTGGTGDQVQWGIAQSSSSFDLGASIPVFQVASGAGAGTLWQYLLSDHQVYEVSPGVKTFHMLANELSGTASIDDPTLTAQFFASGYGTIDLAGATGGAVDPATGEE